MQATLRSPILRAMLAFDIEISLMVFMTPILSLMLWQNSDVTGGFALAVSLTAIPVNYVYNAIFDRMLLRQDKPLYERSFGLRLTHALLLEVIMLCLIVPLAMHMLGVGFGKALALGLFMTVLTGTYNLFMNRAFDSQE